MRSIIIILILSITISAFSANVWIYPNSENWEAKIDYEVPDYTGTVIQSATSSWVYSATNCELVKMKTALKYSAQLGAATHAGIILDKMNFDCE